MTRQTNTLWNLYEQQPVLLRHPEDVLVPVIVSPAKGGIVWWNLGYIASCNMPGGMPGSGFAENPVKGTPRYNQAADCYLLQDRQKRIYIFQKPDEETLRFWEQYKQYIPNREYFDKTAAIMKV